MAEPISNISVVNSVCAHWSHWGILSASRYFANHGYASATRPEPGRPPNAYVREDQILPHLASIAILLAGSAAKPARANRGSAQLTGSDGTAAPINPLGADGAVLTYDPDGRTLLAAGYDAPSVTIGKDH